MSQIYVGYGFDAEDVAGRDKLILLSKYDREQYKRCIEAAREADDVIFGGEMVQLFLTQDIETIEKMTDRGNKLATMDFGGWNIDVSVALGILDDIASEYIEDKYYGTSCFLRDIINKNEAKTAGLGDENVVQAHGKYLVFDSIAFLDESRKRAQLIPSQGAFIEMIGKYVSLDNITFGSLWEGSELDDANYFID